MHAATVIRISQGRESDGLSHESDTMLRKRTRDARPGRDADGLFVRSSDAFIPIFQDPKPPIWGMRVADWRTVFVCFVPDLVLRVSGKIGVVLDVVCRS